LDVATIAKIEADRIYALILPEMEDQETVTVPLPFLENVLTTGQKLKGLAPAYITRRWMGSPGRRRSTGSGGRPSSPDRVSHSSRPRFGRRRSRRRGGHRECDAVAIITGFG
jgi:hypothetical protein